MEKKRKIPIKKSSLGRNNLAVIFKVNLDKKGFSSWKEFTAKIGEDNPRTFIDWFNGKQLIQKEVIEKAFEELEIEKELINIYCVPTIKYKLRGVK